MKWKSNLTFAPGSPCIPGKPRRPWLPCGKQKETLNMIHLSILLTYQEMELHSHKIKLTLSLWVHFFGKIQKWIIAWDHTDSFLPKKQKFRKEIHRGFFSAKETKNPKTDFSRATILARRPLVKCIFFESFSKETQKRQILRIRIQIHWILVASWFIGFIILFGFRIRIRIFLKEMYPICSSPNKEKALYGGTPIQTDKKGIRVGEMQKPFI